MPLKNLVQSRIVSLTNMVTHEIMEDNDTTLDTILGALEKGIVESVYTMCLGNKLETARRLGISRGGLYIKLRQYDLIDSTESAKSKARDELGLARRDVG